MALGSKPQRMRQHDEIALPLVRETLAKHGFGCHVMGTESDTEETRRALAGQKDSVSLMLRFRPDQIAVRPGVRSLMAEVKSERGTSPNFSVEVDAYLAAKQHDGDGRRVMLCFVEVEWKRASACWLSDLPRPFHIQVPKRWDWKENEVRLRDALPSVIVRYLDYRPEVGMSGTPFFLIPKSEPFLQSLDQFLRVQVLDCAPEPEGVAS